MRRKTPTAQLTPKSIKQIAMAAVGVTGLIALFVNGERTQLEAAIQAREAKNRLIELEAQKLGAHKVNAGLKIAKQEQTGEGFERLNNNQPDVSNPTSPQQWSAPPIDRRPLFLRDGGGAVPPKRSQGVKSTRPKRVKEGAEETALLKRSAALRSGSKTADLPD